MKGGEGVKRGEEVGAAKNVWGCERREGLGAAGREKMERLGGRGINGREEETCGGVERIRRGRGRRSGGREEDEKVKLNIKNT